MTGKWCIFVSPAFVDSAWAKIADAVDADKLMAAKISTALRSMRRDTHAICVYTKSWADRQNILRTREELRSLGFVEELGHKRDIDTRNKIYGLGE